MNGLTRIPPHSDRSRPSLGEAARISRRRFIGTAAAATMAGLAGGAQAQQWPWKPIRIICGYPVGGLVDLFARAYGNHLAQSLGQSVIVENKPGANGIIAAQALVQSAPDGHSLLFTLSSTLISNRVLYATLPYDPDRDFSPISCMTTGQLPLLVLESTGIKTVGGLAEYGRNHSLSFGTFGIGSYAHVAAAELSRHLGIRIEPVHYKGEAPMWKDLASGVIQAATGSYAGANALLRAGVARAIAVNQVSRMAKLPDVPTFLEQGIDSDIFQLRAFVACLSPAGTPMDVVARLSSLIVEGGKTKAIETILNTFGIEDAAVGEADFKKLLAEETNPWLRAVRDLELLPL
jgi:tripartite-type tricarboxylate transporter receptor subunit TctC